MIVVPQGKRVCISTDDVPPRQRIPYWEAVSIETCVSLNCRTYSERGFQARQTVVDLGGLRVLDILGNDHVVERSPQHIRRHAKDSIFMCLLMGGNSFLYQGSECAKQAAGDIVIYDANRPYLHGFSSPLRNIVLDLPGPEFRRRFGEWRHSDVVHLNGSMDFGKAISSLLQAKVRSLFAEGAVDPGPRSDALAEEFWQIIETAIGTVQPGCELGASGVLTLVRARAYIAEHLGDRELDCERVARSVGVSARHLRRLFSQEGTSVASLIRDSRLHKARKGLLERHRHRASIGEIAYRCGFSSQSHFSRLYKTRFGETPQQTAAAAAGHGGRRPQSANS